MKNFSIGILLFVSNLLFSQQDIFDSKTILGKWEITKVEIENVIIAEKGKNPTLSDTIDTQSRNFINGLAKSISEEYLHSIFYFKTNNRLKIRTKRKKINGSYSLKSEKKAIVTDIKFFKELLVFSFDGNTLIINQVDENNLIRLTFTKK